MGAWSSTHICFPNKNVESDCWHQTDVTADPPGLLAVELKLGHVELLFWLQLNLWIQISSVADICGLHSLSTQMLESVGLHAHQNGLCWRLGGNCGVPYCGTGKPLLRWKEMLLRATYPTLAPTWWANPQKTPEASIFGNSEAST